MLLVPFVDTWPPQCTTKYFEVATVHSCRRARSTPLPERKFELQCAPSVERCAGDRNTVMVSRVSCRPQRVGRAFFGGFRVREVFFNDVVVVVVYIMIAVVTPLPALRYPHDDPVENDEAE